MKYLQGLGGYSAEMYSRPIASVEKVSAAGSTAAAENISNNPVDDSPAAVVSISGNSVDPLKKIGNYGNILEKIRENRAMAAGTSKEAEGYSVTDELEKQNERHAEAMEKLDEQNAERAERAKEYYEKLDEQNEKLAEVNKEAVDRLRENLKEIVKKQVLVKDDGVYLETTVTKNGSSTSRRVRIG